MQTRMLIEIIKAKLEMIKIVLDVRPSPRKWKRNSQLTLKPFKASSTKSTPS